MDLKCIMMTENKPVSEVYILFVSLYRTFSNDKIIKRKHRGWGAQQCDSKRGA